MSYSTPAGGYQIDVVDETGRAYRTVFGNAQLVAEMALLPFVIVLATEVIAVLLPSDSFFGQFFAGVLELAGFLIFATIFLVRWHRFVLLGETVASGFIPPGWSTFFFTGLKLGIAVFVGWLLMALVAVLPPHLLTLPLSALGGVALTLLSMRVSLIFPAAAIERPAGFTAAWRWVGGNFWRLFICIVVCYLPFIVVEFVIGRIGAQSPTALWIVFQALRLGASFVGLAVVATLLSHVYRDIIPEPAEVGAL